MNWIRHLTIATMLLIQNSNMFKVCHHPVNHGPNVLIISMAQGTIPRLQLHHLFYPSSSRYSTKSNMPWHNLIQMKMSWKLLILLSLLRNKRMILRRKQFWWKENVRMEKRMSGKMMKRWKLRMMKTKKKLKKRLTTKKKRGMMKKSWKKRVTRKKKWWKERWKKKATRKSNNMNRRRLQRGKKVKISSNSRISKKWRLQNPILMLISYHPH
mmetsp:Transcript_16610/g.25100  ORF Transcript_16610/g.25100 Transcript_16610/m.25100 type:complete len:212 (-) Transcript_16610:86-721(-)